MAAEDCVRRYVRANHPVTPIFLLNSTQVDFWDLSGARRISTEAAIGEVSTVIHSLLLRIFRQSMACPHCFGDSFAH
jgi:hypothetical protein